MLDYHVAAYQYDIEFQPTHTQGNADCLSQLRLNIPATAGQADAASLFNIHQIGTLPVNAGQLKQQTGQDPILAKVTDFTLTGWPSTAPPEFKPFFNRRFEITIETGCLMWGIRVIVPAKKLRERVLKELHTGHPRIVKMKSLARTLVW